MRTLVLYNPQSGRKRHRREALVEQAADRLRARGFDCHCEATTGVGSAGAQVRKAVEQGTQVIFACGGDGTVHDVLQGVAGTGVFMGILPMGSANALARELGISRDPVKAAEGFRPGCFRNILLSSVQKHAESRYFLSMAGAGPDGALMHHMLTVDRGTWGHWLYYAHALRLYLRRAFPRIVARYRTLDGTGHERECVSAMTVRIRTLGGLFRTLARGASLEQPQMRLILVHPPATLSLPLWFLTSWLHVARWNPWLTIVPAVSVELLPSSTPVHLQADGEWLGTIPCRIELLPERIAMLVP